MAVLLSFDIDGTLELGDPPGGVTMEMVRHAHSLGYIVGSCSDRPLSAQRAVWEKIGVTPHFVAGKDQLGEVRAQVVADAYYHVGDRDTDKQVAEENGFGFWWEHPAVDGSCGCDPNAHARDEPWLATSGSDEASS